MVKFLQTIKNNNKASILPVTVIAMFIMMIIAYACIKMFLVQNVIVTQDQIKARVTYAAEGIAQKQVMSLQAAINAKINEDPNVEITEDTVFDATGIKNLKKNGANYNFLFSDVLTKTATQDPDVVSGQDFFTATGINGSSGTYTDSMLENVIMFPRIKSLGWTFGTYSLPTAVRKDGGVAFYKTKGVTVTEANLNYDNLIDINSTVYPYNGTTDPRTIDSLSITSDLESCIYDNSYGNSFVEFFATVNNWANEEGNPLSTTNTQHLIDRRPISGSIEQTVTNRIETLKTHFKSTYSTWDLAETKFGPRTRPSDLTNNYYIVRITAFEVRYLVKNFRCGYVITGKATSPNISNKIPPITSEVKIYFDLFMTKLYKQYTSYPSSTYGDVWFLNKNNWDTATWQYKNNTYAGSQLQSFVVDTYKHHKYIDNVKLHIQKWEVVS